MQYLMLLMGKYPAPLRMPQKPLSDFEGYWSMVKTLLHSARPGQAKRIENAASSSVQ